MCADCPTSDKEKEPNFQPGGMESQTKPKPGRGGGGVCQGGCGLKLSGEEHCCVDALRSVTDALEERSAILEHEARMSRLRWNRREQYLLAQVSTLQNEAQLAALQYQRRLHQYMLHISSIAEQVTGFYKGDKSATCEKRTQASDAATCAKEEQLTAPEVNGKELSKSSHEETLEAFRPAKDPVVVQVIRRTPSGRPHGPPQEIHVVDVCTQTDITFEHIMALAKLRPSTPPVPDVCPFLLSDSCHSLHTMDQDYYDGTDYLSPVPADGERAEEFEYEEVELCRLSSQEKLGLTLCYRTDEEEDVAIYVSEISPNSIAARDGRIREGDRILQINGQDIQDREEAMAALSNEQCRNIVLLVARPEMQLEEAWLDDEHSEFLEQLKMEMLEEQQREEMELAALQEEDQENEQRAEDDEPTCSTLPHKNNVQTIKDRMDSSDQNVLAHIQRRLSQCLRDSRDAHRTSGSMRLEDKEDDDDDEIEGDRFQQLLELKCQIRNSGEYDLFYSRSTIECSMGEQGGVQHELRMLNEELRSIELECQNIMQAHNLRKGQQSPSTGNSGPSTKNQSLHRSDPTRGKLADINERLEKSDKDSSSAYNTAESSRSTPLAMDRSPEHSLQRMVSLTNQRNLCSSLATGPSLSPSPVLSCRVPVPGKSSSPDHSNPSNHTPQAEEESSGALKPHSSRIPYFSPSHSSQQRQANIPAHARHYQSYMQLIQQRSAVEYAQSQLSLLSVCKEPQRPINEPKMEWKVKIRSDGTRYITKRPVRDKILRERALKIKEERSGGMTTDDDAMSEMKMGKYWSKEERKQHLVRAKEQRKRREFMQRSRLESLKENPQSSSEGRKEVSIIELSHKKMLKKRNKKILDNWMTIQELMTHGTKAPEGAKVHNAFLSVTTV
ncbi:PDZ domain-containing RING finger protein 4-like isoform X1 [Notolabrus celidotus]|uniref:PDZ domain-containing RING finger protein 4-like isoform X1 n=1 Tax=Notolabrus celidotus TaxID=1203425 RepID=UPI00148FA324|nr:PDZ domain-containing RING finger protein 4-like isoform X1 [Notolabrus celidotus]XP_034542359.1 PDZ domain-containing RING finger protein 4-like isoform X1 [Notolabrus celidotus]XP_034542360.1 PDZ domain-containing RING finger protein 4-like isoform X1 [Notolabrus celidotus]